MKTSGASTTVFVYDVHGKLVAEYNGPPGTNSGTSYLITDHLSSTRLITDSQGVVRARHDFLPFGEEIQAGIGGRTTAQGYSAPDDTRQKFTSKERDNESGLDYFLARYHSSAQGRFTSNDPYNIVMETQTAADKKKAEKQFHTYLSNPQRWNRYPYALNNPLLYTDPEGEDVTIYYIPGASDTGHIFIYVKNDETGESAYFDFVPDSEKKISPLWGNNNTMIMAADQKRIDSAASLTIETTAEQEQAILNGIKNFIANPKDWSTFGCNCVSQSEALLKLGGIDIKGATPAGFWDSAIRGYADNKPPSTPPSWPSFPNPRTYNPGFQGSAPEAVPGREYNRDPRGQARKLDKEAIPHQLIYKNKGAGGG